MENLYTHFQNKLKECLVNYGSDNSITEIRLRAENTLQFTERGRLKDISYVYINQKELEEIFHSMCDYSQNVYEDEISQGYITLNNGYRVGIGGDFYYNVNAQKYLLRKLYSLNITSLFLRSFCFIGQESIKILD